VRASIDARFSVTNKYFRFLQFLYIYDTYQKAPCFIGQYELFDIDADN